MNAEDHARMTDEERAARDRRSHRIALAVTVAVGIVSLLIMVWLNDYYADTPMCGTGQDYGPC
ncbi:MULTISPECIES: hypothetical protein [Streptomyces]|uniref:hypothetical protein n=1 Tax=Streptomyces TaxID=1883 RepID=UPI00030CED1D|nr:MULTISPECIES: hypothetical protein [Streptomyces]MBP5862021.1 hypothetical protein [Streptomyces sp. LBUM 1484]MBP5869032.1 hypothetical protein [Streptomyces sp. LBUM 1485]MBP5907525.1 hypothetical protein [Streptomyces sp. LBUM 1478]MBP5929576.1 hypothetical protein [Streptomyces sp. LBUM 1479]KFG07023.1 hypothetical protein IQ61_21720 [Streptomyces scabiei]